MDFVEVFLRQAIQGIYTTAICSLDKGKSSVCCVVGFFSPGKPGILTSLLVIGLQFCCCLQRPFHKLVKVSTELLRSKKHWILSAILNNRYSTLQKIALSSRLSYMATDCESYHITAIAGLHHFEKPLHLETRWPMKRILHHYSLQLNTAIHFYSFL